MEATIARSFWKSKKNQHNQKNIHNEMRQPLTGEKVWRGCINTSFEDSNDLIVFSDSIERRVLDGSCRFVCYCCCFLYGYRLDVCILNSKYDFFFVCCWFFFIKNILSVEKRRFCHPLSYWQRWDTPMICSAERWQSYSNTRI